MSYEFYKILHLASLAALILGFGLIIGMFSVKPGATGGLRKMAFLLHGIGITLMLVSGFGLLARLGLVQGLPAWIYGKLLIWLILGGMIALVKRKPELKYVSSALVIGLVFCAAVLAVSKPWQ